MPKTQTRRVPRRPKRPKKPVSRTEIRKNARQLQDSFGLMTTDKIKAQIAALQNMLQQPSQKTKPGKTIKPKLGLRPKRNK